MTEPMNTITVEREGDANESLGIYIRVGDPQLEELLRMFIKGSRNFDIVYQSLQAADTDRTQQIASAMPRPEADMPDNEVVTLPVLGVLNALQEQLTKIPK